MTATKIKGVGNVDADELGIARLTVLQGISKEVAEKGLPVGKIYNKATQAIADSVVIIPIKRIKEYFAIKDNGTFDFKTTDKNDPRLEGLRWKMEDGKKAQAKTVITWTFVIDGELNTPIEMSFANTSMPVHRELISGIVSSGKSPWAYKYTLTAKKADGKAYFVPVITRAGEVSEADQKTLEALFDSLTGAEEAVPF